MAALKKENVHLEYEDLDVVLGFNSKQWWIYSNTYDVYIDPPSEVLNAIEEYSSDEQEEALDKIIETIPDWLYDVDYWYDAEEYEI